MEYAIQLLEKERIKLDKSVKKNNLLQRDMTKATKEFSKITELKNAIKILKSKYRKK